MYYVISLTHTYSYEKHLTLWRANNVGYCSSKQLAGVYEIPTEGYHNSEGNLPIPVQQLGPLFVEVDYEGEKRLMIPNDSRTWNVLGVRMDKRQGCLVRKSKTILPVQQIAIILLLLTTLAGCRSWESLKRKYSTNVVDTTFTTVTTTIPKDSAVLVLRTDTTRVIERFRQGRASVTIIREPTNTTVIANCDSVAIQKKVPQYLVRQVWGVDPKFEKQAKWFKTGFFGLLAVVVLTGIVVWLLSRFTFTAPTVRRKRTDESNA